MLRYHKKVHCWHCQVLVDLPNLKQKTFSFQSFFLSL